MAKFNILFLSGFIFSFQDKGILLTTYDIVRNNSKSLRGDHYFIDDESEDSYIWDYMILDEVNSEVSNLVCITPDVFTYRNHVGINWILGIFLFFFDVSTLKRLLFLCYVSPGTSHKKS